MRISQDLQVSETPREFIEHIPSTYMCVKKRRSKTEYINYTACFDIETTNTDIDGFAYSFQLDIAGVNVVVRYFEDILKIFDSVIDFYNLSSSRRLVIYVHNLGYEHFYLTQLFASKWGQPESLFTKPRKPLTIRYNNGIEFRDSLKLFQKSLEKATKGCKHEKLKGDLDYSVYRTPDTEVTEQEFDYMVNDVQGLYEAIERLKQEHSYNAATIPLTNTGMVIEAVNEKLRAERGGHTIAKMRDLVLNKEQLKLAYKCMAGGDTHGTRWRAGQVYYNCNSYDLKSAHPSQQILRKFPSGEPFSLPKDITEDELELLTRDNEFGWLGLVFVCDFQIRPECPNPTVSFSKCEDIEGIRGKDNGRVMGADGALIYMDSNDWWRFKQSYTYNHMLGVDILGFSLAYLPQAFRDAILDFFKIKESAEDGPERVFAKICVNTIFGACAQKTIRDEYTINIDDILSCEHISWEDNLNDKVEAEVIKSQLKKFPFLWGLWTSSLTRLELYKLQRQVGWERLIYWDTDSCKYEGDKISEVDTVYNARVVGECKDREAIVLNRKNQLVYIGTAEDEHPTVKYGYVEFTFLHAKCYAAKAWNIKKQAYEIETTIAGVRKENGVNAMNGDISNLQDGLFIEDAGGLALSYHDKPITKRNDFKRPTISASYIVMTPRQYLVQNGIPDYIEERDDIIC